ncbi:MAG: hypothetical protein IPK50_17035 [Fibrobacterota bacterium]|nr:hypothetical protein [Fibrobacterota bacterium]QQS03985.1 MAG: hypothetical protein IPK50_17035 [Fibrobacterota bacterium]
MRAIQAWAIALGVVGVLASCDGGRDEEPYCRTTCTSDQEYPLSGSFRSAVGVKGVYQTFTFGPDSAAVYVRENGCVEERDSGRALLKAISGSAVLQVRLDRGWGMDATYRGRACAPLVPLAKGEMTAMEDPFPFRWLDGAEAFEIQVSPVSWMRFDKI